MNNTYGDLGGSPDIGFDERVNGASQGHSKVIIFNMKYST